MITSNPIDFDAYATLQLSFYAEATFGNTPLTVVYSADYDGGSNPSNFTWTNIPNYTPLTHPDASNSEEAFFVDDVNLNSISGSVYLAFRYDTTNGEEATRWTIDEFLVEATTLSTSNFESIDLSLYPNPTQGNTFFIATEAVLDELQIFNLSGKRVLQLKQP